jgi:hypothetical protein
MAQCSYIVSGSGRRAVFCDQKAMNGSAYCQEHHELTHADRKVQAELDREYHLRKAKRPWLNDGRKWRSAPKGGGVRKML